MKGTVIELLGVAFLSDALFQARKNPGFVRVRRLLQKLTEADPIMTRPAEPGEARNLSFELEVASLGLVGGYDTQLDEPDVVLREGAEEWGMACKMISSANPVTICDRVEEGIEQALRATPHHALVVLGLANALPTDSFLLSSKYAPRAASRSRQLVEEVRRFADMIKNEARTRFHKGRESERFRGIFTLSHRVAIENGQFQLENHLGVIHEGIYGPEEQLARRFDRALRALAP